MAVTHLKADSAYRRMAWKNGRGETIEIARHPDGGDLSAFDWRISMAAVTEDGPFSSFPGIDRTLAVLTGTGLVLSIDGREEVRLTATTAPLAFPADVSTSARLLADPVTDLNLMTRRGPYAHRMTAMALPAVHAGIEGGLVYLVLKGTATIQGNGVAANLADTDAIRLDGPGDRVDMTGEGMIYRLEIRRL